MKKAVGYVLSRSLFSVGSLLNWISYIKRNGKFFFDAKGWRSVVGYWLAAQYQRFMRLSSEVQDWSGAGVWRNVADTDLG